MSTAPPPPPPPSQQPAGYGGPPVYVGEQKAIGKQILISIVTLGIYGIYWAYKSHEDVKLHSGQGVGGAVGAIIYFFVSIVTVFLLPSEIKNMYEREGQESPVSWTTGFWILLFAIPWYVKVQQALNDHWASHGAPPPEGWAI
jgi:hypothetical protein